MPINGQFPDLPCPHCGQLVKLVRQVGRPAFVDLPKVVKPAERKPVLPPPPPPWKEPLKSFTEALNVGIREAVAESGRLTLEAIRALPQPPATVVNYTPPPIELPDPAPIHYTPPPVEIPPPAPIHYTPPPQPAPVVQVVDAPPTITTEQIAAVARREAERSTQGVVNQIAPVLDRVIALASRPPAVMPADRPEEDADFLFEPMADGTTRVTRKAASGVTEFSIEQRPDGSMKVSRRKG
jgi:hypothetical protein